jgi:hypothetical protein
MTSDVHTDPASGPGAVATDSTAAVLGAFWTELLDKPPAAPSQLLLEAGGNSLIATMLANRIELAWGIRPSMEELLSLSFSRLCAWCEERGTP